MKNRLFLTMIIPGILLSNTAPIVEKLEKSYSTVLSSALSQMKQIAADEKKLLKERVTLNYIDVNGTKVPLIFEEDKNLPIASMQLIFKNSGALADTKDGLVKLTGKLLNDGTKKEGAMGFANRLESRAIGLSANSGAETFVIELSSLKSEFPYGIELFKELLEDPNYSDETLKKIKTKTVGQLKSKESDYDYISSLAMKKMIFPNTSLAKSSLGTVESVENITLEDIKGYVKGHLGLENAIVVMGGDLNISEAQTLAKVVLDTLPNVKSIDFETMHAEGKAQVKESIVKSEQAYVYFGAPLKVAYDSTERHLSQVASFILGSSGFGSRMMEEIRVKKGLAYSAYSRFNINKSHSYFSGYLQTKVESGEESVEAVKEVVKLFLDKGVTQEELTSAQQFLLGSEPLRNETLSQRLNRAFQEFYTNRPLGSSSENLKKIEAITLSEINGFIKKHREIENISFSVVTGEKKK